MPHERAQGLKCAGKDACPPPRTPLPPSATPGGDWGLAPGDGRNESGLRLHIVLRARERTHVLSRETPSCEMRRPEAIGTSVGASDGLRAEFRFPAHRLKGRARAGCPV